MRTTTAEIQPNIMVDMKWCPTCHKWQYTIVSTKDKDLLCPVCDRMLQDSHYG